LPAADGLLRGIDRAAFAVAFSTRLRRAGVPVGLTATQDFVRALSVSPPTSTSALYWTARISLVRRQADLAAFDAVFTAVHADPDAPTQPGRGDDRYAPVPAATDTTESGGGLPWATLPPAVDEAEDADTDLVTPQRRPSAAEALADRPFEELDAEQLALLGDWLRDALRDWPARRSRRQVRDPAGHRIALRPTMARARRTGWEPIHLVRVRPVRRPRPVVMLCDVSQSMQAQIPAFLLLMRALSDVAHAETFAFATALTRLTGAADAAAVPDRFGGTRIASNIRALLASRHADTLRGAVVIIGSDGWDSDPPADLAVAMARLRRRAHTVIWLNPRAGVAGFRPEVAAMAAALPYCDELLPADTFRALRAAINSITSRGSRGGTARR
jgi:uncharacterized protein with von Willebrand factor type A (vWA) domain